MTREELKKIATCYAQDELKDNHSAVEDVVSSAFIDGVNYAEQHPHWISVEDELPKGEHLSADVLIVGCGEVWYGYYDHDNDQWYPTISDITHWMPLPQAPSCSEFPNNSKKGGEK